MVNYRYSGWNSLKRVCFYLNRALWGALEVGQRGYPPIRLGGSEGYPPIKLPSDYLGGGGGEGYPPI